MTPKEIVMSGYQYFSGEIWNLSVKFFTKMQ